MQSITQSLCGSCVCCWFDDVAAGGRCYSDTEAGVHGAAEGRVRARGQVCSPRVSLHRRAAAADSVAVQRRADTAKRHVPGTFNPPRYRKVSVFTARAMLSAVLLHCGRPPSVRPPFSFRHRALKRGGINRYSRTAVVVIYSAIVGDH